MLLLSMVSCHYFQAFGSVFGPENEVLVDLLSNPTSVLDVLDDPMDGELKLAHLLHNNFSYPTKTEGVLFQST